MIKVELKIFQNKFEVKLINNEKKSLLYHLGNLPRDGGSTRPKV